MPALGETPQQAAITVASVVGAVVLVVGWVRFGLPSRLRREFEQSVPEARLSYSPESVDEYLDWIAPGGIALYRLELGWDIVFALAFGGLLTLAMRGLWVPHLPDGSPWRLTAWLPAAYALFDVMEDLFLLYAVAWPPADDGAKIPGVPRRAVFTAHWLTRGKFLCVGLSGLLILIGGGIQAVSVPKHPHPRRQAVFTYSMPARFGFDMNGDGLTDYPHAAEVQQSTFTLNLNACATRGSISTYAWTVDGTPEGTVTERSPECQWSLDLPERTYPVKLSVRWRDGVVRSRRKHVTVQDWLIVAAGDAFASGQGAPQTKTGSVPHWQEPSCDQSAEAGAAQAALALEQEDARSSVTFVHVACSGATIQDGLLRPERLGSAGDVGQSQLATIRTLVGRRRIDALVLSIGSNDIGFNGIVSQCLMPLVTCGHRHQTQRVSDNIKQLTGTGGAFFSLFACLSGHEKKCPFGSGLLRTPPRHILVTAYPDMTQQWLSGALQNCSYLSLSGTELGWVRESVLKPLNTALADVWQTLGATFLTFPPSLWESHGICASDPWFNGALDPLEVENGTTGAFHPNDEGYALGYGPMILAGFHDADIGPSTTVAL